MGGFRMNIFNKTTVMTLTLIAVITVTMCTQQYDSESDFEVECGEEGVTITVYLGSKTNIRIPPRIQNLPVTSIGGIGFWNCASITSVIIPVGVTSIGDLAFMNCTRLATINIPDGITSINHATFWKCTSLATIIIPDGVTSIGEEAFAFCTNLTDITIPDSVTSIGNRTFWDCTSLINVTIPNSITSIGDGTFKYCTSLTSITIPDSVASIESSAFNNCASLTSIIIPSGVTSIGERAFSFCRNLASITIPNSVTSIGDSAFNASFKLTSITIPNSVTSIGEAAFDNCRNLASVTFEGTIPSSGFSENGDYGHTFPGDLRDKFYATDKTNGTPGTYTTTAPVGESSVWIKQPLRRECIMIDSFVNADFVVQVGGIYPVFKGHTDLYAYGIVGLFSSMKETDFTGKMSHFIAHLHIQKETGLVVQITTFQHDGVGKDLVGPMELIALATPEEWKKF
jgi:hypothetical protein